jgi:hypothetical protein
MSKRQDGIPGFTAVARSLALTRQEQAMVAAILLSMLVGSLVMHLRREYRLQHPAQTTVAPHRASGASNF